MWLLIGAGIPPPGEEGNVNLCGFNFEGPYDSPDELREGAGVYVVLSVRPGKHDIMLDVGESGWNLPQGQGVRSRLKSHSRRTCWEEHSQGGLIAFAVLYERDGMQRLKVEEVLRRFYQPPCGTDP